MRADDVNIWGDGSTYKGNDIERFYRYGLLANQDLRIYKPWLDADFVNELGGRSEMSAVPDRARPPLPRQRREGLLDRREPLGRDARGEAARVARDADGHRRADHGRRALEARGRDRRGGDRAALRGGLAGRDQRRRRSTRSSSSCMEANAIGGRHGLGMSDQIENRIIEAKSRGIYEGPGWRCCTSATSGSCQRDPQRGQHRQLPHDGPPPRPAALRGPLVRPAGAHAARPAAALRRLRDHRRGRRAPAPRRRLHARQHDRPRR